MFNIQYSGHTVLCKPNETLLECFLRSGLQIDFSCKSGVCHRCMVKCISGEIPEAASKKLPPTHQGQNYLLSCQCIPTTDMHIVMKTSEDIVTKCVVSAFSQTTVHTWKLDCETYRELSYKTGQYIVIMDLTRTYSTLGMLISNPDRGTELSIEIQSNNIIGIEQKGLNIEGNDFYIKGPLSTPPIAKQERLKPNPILWEQLGGDEKMRTILTTFYKKVYADKQLAPFFERITIERIIGKQFAFLKENIVGEQIYLGEQPRNSHHWMVISESLFQHRMDLMHQSLQEHLVPQILIKELEMYEFQFKEDIVKSQAWLKQIGNLFIDTEKYEECHLDEATICDYCGAEIAKGSLVRFHTRIGKLACQNCSVTKNSKLSYISQT